LEIKASVASEIADKGAGFGLLDEFEKTKGWLDQSITWVIATRGKYDAKVVDAWDMLDWPMNEARTGRLTARNMEVAEAYNHLFRMCIDRDYCERSYNALYTEVIVGTQFILTTEEDNILPPNAPTALAAAIYTCPDCGRTLANAKLNPDWLCPEGHRGYDAVSGLYMTKVVPPRPMAFGDPKNGPDDFRPQSVKEAVASGSVIEVNGIAMGCALWRKDLVRRVSEPWFVTTPSNNMTGSGGGTQDLYFCRKAKAEIGARFGVHCGVRVGHMDYRTGQVF
jgi:hypothetical protein